MPQVISSDLLKRKGDYLKSSYRKVYLHWTKTGFRGNGYTAVYVFPIETQQEAEASEMDQLVSNVKVNMAFDHFDSVGDPQAEGVAQW